MLASPDMTKIKTADYAGKKIACSCGREHTVSTACIYLGENALVMLKSVVGEITPAGKVLFVTCEDVYNLYGKAIAGDLKALGYEVLLHIFPSGTKADIAFCEVIKTPEDCRAVISLGSGSLTDMAKYFSYKSGKKLVAIATAPTYSGYLSDVSYLYNKGIKESTDSRPPHALICDLKIMRAAPRKMLAAGFGEIMSGLIAMFDWQFAHLIDGEELCENIFSLAGQCIKMCAGIGEGLIRQQSGSIDVLCDALLRSSICLQLLQGSKHADGSRGMAHALELMSKDRKGDTAMHGELAFLSAAHLVKLYRYFLNNKFSDTLLPVDKALRADKLAALTGNPAHGALKKFDYKLDHKSEEVRRYKVEEFRVDLCENIKEIGAKIDHALTVFKRIYEDAGYWINGFLKESEIKRAIAIAPDLSESFSLLSHMRNIGLLDRYLI